MILLFWYQATANPVSNKAMIPGANEGTTPTPETEAPVTML